MALLEQHYESRTKPNETYNSSWYSTFDYLDPRIELDYSRAVHRVLLRAYNRLTGKYVTLEAVDIPSGYEYDEGEPDWSPNKKKFSFWFRFTPND